MVIEPAFPTVVAAHLRQLFEDLGLAAAMLAAELDAALQDIMLGLGQVLTDVERAQRRRVPLSQAVHLHEDFPYLCRLHGWIQDAFVAAMPPEFVTIMRRLKGISPPEWMETFLDDLCVVARSSAARPEERALARLLIFEGLRVNLFTATYKTHGYFEGVGGCRRDLDEVAGEQLMKLLLIPLEVDASEPYRPFTTTVAAAILRLRERTDQLWEARKYFEELREDVVHRTEFELLLRSADPVDAVILRNKFDGADHHQPIPVTRLPLEHPLILAGHNENSINQRSSRATKKLLQAPTRLAREPRPVTLAELLLEMESSNA